MLEKLAIIAKHAKMNILVEPVTDSEFVRVLILFTLNDVKNRSLNIEPIQSIGMPDELEAMISDNIDEFLAKSLSSLERMTSIYKSVQKAENLATEAAKKKTATKKTPAKKTVTTSATTEKVVEVKKEVDLFAEPTFIDDKSKEKAKEEIKKIVKEVGILRKEKVIIASVKPPNPQFDLEKQADLQEKANEIMVEKKLPPPPSRVQISGETMGTGAARDTMAEELAEMEKENYARANAKVLPISPEEAFGMPELPPIEGLAKVARDQIELMKKNNGEDYLNKANELIVQAPKVVIDPLKAKWDELLLKAEQYGITTNGIVFKGQTDESLESLNAYLDNTIKTRNLKPIL